MSAVNEKYVRDDLVLNQAYASQVFAPHQLQGDQKLFADAVIVGSGAGGATVATTLAQAGMRVILVEEGLYYSAEDFGADFSAMTSQIMRNAGATVILGRSPIAYLEGKVVGGSTVLNGGMCWRTPDEVLDNWVNQKNLDQFSNHALDSHFAFVEKQINARYQDLGSAGQNNQVFLDGVQKLGWQWQHNIRNQKHCVGSNDCVTGCPSGAKQSTAKSWLPDFLKFGGILLTGIEIKEILIANERAYGVRGMVKNPLGQNQKIEVQGMATFIACGAVQTPLLLQRSKIKNPHLGKHFTVHPNIKAAALFDQPIDSMKGVHQAWQCTEFKKDGILLAPGGIPLSVMAQCLPKLGQDLAHEMKLVRYIATGGLLVDDSVEGSVKALPFGINQVRYDLSDADQDKFIFAFQKIATLYFEAGARLVYTPFHHFPVIHHPEQIKRLALHKPKVEDTEYFTAHLMGTCRISAEMKDGVVDQHGKVWGINGLYIADASVLPSTIGVNPQVTIMTIARKIAMDYLNGFTSKT
jgi:choline dehydrogenase-like flavoprotein